MIRYLLTLACISAASFAIAAELTVKKGQQLNAHQFSTLELWSIFEPTLIEQPKFSSDGLTATFTDIRPGKYAIVCWEATSPWRPSPVYDATIEIQDGRPTVHTIVAETRSTQISLRTDIDLVALFREVAFIPCKVQRLEAPFAPLFGFRWISLTKDETDHYIGLAKLSPGHYTLMIPYPKAREGWPPLKQKPFEGDIPLLAVPIQIPAQESPTQHTPDITVRLSQAKE